MFYYTKDLALNSLESIQERYFVERCKTLLTFSSKDEIVNLAKDKKTFYSTFCNSIISPKDMHLILLRKYYLSTDNDEYGYTVIGKLLSGHYFDEIEQLIQSSPNIRVNLMDTYIKHINSSNCYLSTEKALKVGYDVVNDTICAMNKFYIQYYERGPQLKKEF